MDTNETPVFDDSERLTGCCPRFNKAGWDGQNLHFENKLFARVKTKSILHIPIDMAPIFAKTQKAIDAAHAQSGRQFIVLSRELSPWSAEHLFAVERVVPGAEMIRLSGEFRTKVFEGPFKEAPKWETEVRDELAAAGEKVGKIYLFYTTCPKCAQTYGKNYVVAVAEHAPKQESIMPSAHEVLRAS